MSAKRIGIALGLAAVFGWSVFGYLLASVSQYERADASLAAARLDSIRSLYADPEPMLSAGRVRKLLPDSVTVEATTLHVLVYRKSLESMLQVDAPLWFLQLKGPAIQFVLRDTGVDMKELGVTAEQLRLHGPMVVMDEARAGGDHLLLWTDAP